MASALSPPLVYGLRNSNSYTIPVVFLPEGEGSQGWGRQGFPTAGLSWGKGCTCPPLGTEPILAP